MRAHFELDKVGQLKEYIGCKVDLNREEGWVKLTQPVLMQSYVDEFDISVSEAPRMPAIPGEVLQKGEPSDHVTPEEQTKYRSGVGKLLHMMKWTRPEILNAVRELSRFMTGATRAHMVALYCVMKYCVGTPNRGLLLMPDTAWDGDPDLNS